jgi:Proliferating cell nuclear antigen, N-terminal domain
MICAEFVPKHLEKALDMARHIATFGHLEFTGGTIQLQITDPAKVVHMDMVLVPDTYKFDKDLRFGINLQMFYKLFRTLDPDQAVEIEADESVMKINQGSRFHTLLHQDVPFPIPEILHFSGPKIVLPTKLFQKYIRAIGNIAPAFELSYSPTSDVLQLESVNSIYRTLFSIDTGVCPTDGTEDYRKNFMVKFVEMAINPSLADKIELTLGEQLIVGYIKDKLNVIVVVSGYTEA